MSIGVNGLYVSYLESERKLKEYRNKRMLKPVRVARIKIDESDFGRTISVTTDERVFYLDHVLLGVIKRGRFVGNRWAYKVVSMAGVRKVKQYIEGQRGEKS